jgi:hypothetical protein
MCNGETKLRFPSGILVWILAKLGAGDMSRANKFDFAGDAVDCGSLSSREAHAFSFSAAPAKTTLGQSCVGPVLM